MTNILRLNILRVIQKSDPDNTLYYAWGELPKSIQQHFIKWCEKYMQVSHKECFGGWAFGWSKYHEPYLEFLTDEKLFLKDRGMA